jgi:hypothetical protein
MAVYAGKNDVDELFEDTANACGLQDELQKIE